MSSGTSYPPSLSDEAVARYRAAYKSYGRMGLLHEVQRRMFPDGLVTARGLRGEILIRTGLVHDMGTGKVEPMYPVLPEGE